ncbi:MAG TPA: MFS transporter [Methanocorpusculum sp.]|nr:MFS transporter [Methanocorpusculum sp.]
MPVLTKTDILKTVLIIAAAFLAYGLAAGLRAASGVFVSQIADLTGLSYGTVSSVATIRNIVFAIASPLWGFLTLRKSHTFILILGLILTAVGFAGPVIIPSYAGLIIFQGIFFGVGAGAVGYSIVYAAAAPLLSERTAAVFAGILSMSQGIFNIILAPAVKFSSEFDGGFIICMLLIAASLAAIIPLTILFKRRGGHTDAVSDESAEKSPVKTVLRTMVKTPFFYLIAISYFTYGLCQGGMMNHLVQRAVSTMGLNGDGATAVVMLYGAALVVGPLLAGIIASRVANKRFALALMFLLWAAAALISCIAIPPETTGLYIVFIVILGIIISMAVPYHALLTRERVSLTHFAAAFSIITMFEVFGYAVNAYFGGRCFDITGSFLGFDLIVIGLAGIIGIIFAFDGFRKRKLIKQQQT